MKRIIDVLRALKSAANIKSGRGLNEFFTSRLIQATREPHLIAVIESLARSLDASVNFVGGARLAPFMQLAQTPEGNAYLEWIRENPRVTAMLVFLKDEDYESTLADFTPAIYIKPQNTQIKEGCTPSYRIPITVDLLSPLSHGADEKAGNAMLFRRRTLLGKTGQTLIIPYYAGNAVRGLIRDLLADHFLSAIGLGVDRSQPSVAIWFFHAIYAGGALQEGGGDVKKIIATLGNSGAASADGFKVLGDTLPFLSLLGAAMGNKVVSGRVQVGDLKPDCWELRTGNLRAHELTDWVFSTRRDDLVQAGSDETNQMIVNTEVLKEGVTLQGGIDYSNHIQPLELSALGLALELLKKKGRLGGKTREGLGKVKISYENQPDPMPYIQYLIDNKEGILKYLGDIGALV